MSNGKNSKDIESLSLLRYVITFLIGSGGTGAAMALIGQEGFQTYGLVTLIISLVVAIILIIIFIFIEHKVFKGSRSEGLKKLNSLYIDSLKTSGQFFGRGQPNDSKLLSALAGDLRSRIEMQRDIAEDVLFEFTTGVDDVAATWESLAINHGNVETNPIEPE